MHRAYYCLLTVALLIVMARALPADAENVPSSAEITPATHPALVIKGDRASHYPNGRPAAFRGFADPCMRRDPVTGQLWLAYSWPHMKHMGGDRRDFVVGVETHLATSTDGGKTWQFVKTLWPSTPVKWASRITRQREPGFLSHEVPNILPCTIDDKPAWVGVHADYFLSREGNYKGRDSRSFCIRLRTGPSPIKLSDVPQVTFGHAWSSPDCKTDINLCELSRDFPPVFIPTEPALHLRNGRLYFAVVCMAFRDRDTPDFARSFIGLLSTTPRGPVDQWKWRYHGKLAGRKEAAELGGEALTQTEFALDRGGQLLVFLSPARWNAEAAREFGDAFGGIKLRGCAVVEVASLDPPKLARREDGALAVRTFLRASASSPYGTAAAAYEPASATGILLALRNIKAKQELVWSLHQTRLHP